MDDETYIVYDPKLKRPGCVLLQAAMGGNERAANRFPSESWLLYPTPDMGRFKVTPGQLDYLVALAEA